MNKHLDKGDEMKGEKMKIASLIGVLLFCVSTQSTANNSSGQVCAAEMEQALQASIRASGPDWRKYNTNTREHFVKTAEDIFSVPCIRVKGNLVEAKSRLAEVSEVLERAQPNSTYAIDYEAVVANSKFNLCVTRAWAAQCSSSPAPATQPRGNVSDNGANSTNPAAANSQQASRLNRELNEAEARAQNNQAKVDRARKGKPKRHVLGAEAHNCLTPTPQAGGGVTNSCPFAVEYSYCVYRPTKDSWAAAFDCEQSKGGSWQVGPGPNARSIMHTGGERIYWFACKYGPSLRKPDGVSPADIEFQLGRGLLGRCAEWGAGGS